MDNLNSNQLDILAKFKENVRDETKKGYDDRFYSRWLIAQNFDLKKAEKMFRQNLMWRRKYNIDDIMNWKRPDVLRYFYPEGFFGEARDGTPVYYMMKGRLDTKPMYYATRKQDLIKLMAQNFTHLDEVLGPAQSEKHGHCVDQLTLVYDFEGTGREVLWKPNLDLEREMIRGIDANFPERLRRAICINLPWVFPVLWNISKALLSEATRNKVTLLSSNWKTEILEYIAAEQLPVHWGGSAPNPPQVPYTDFDICWGGKIPEKYKNPKPEANLSKFSTHTVARGSSYQVDVPITLPGSIIQWQFLSRDYDISFGVYKRTTAERQKKGDMEELIRNERVDSQHLPIDGCMQCDTPGTYVLRFDNTYSWTKCKDISYCVEVLEPDTEGGVIQDAVLS